MFDLRDSEVIGRIQVQWLEPPAEIEMAPCWCRHEWEHHGENEEATPCDMRNCTCKNYSARDLSDFYEDLDYRNHFCPDK